MHSRSDILAAFGRFLDVLDELREKCPWDRKQTNESLRPNTIEEVYELSDALINDNTQDVCKELGDVALHVAFYAKIASEKGQFDMKDVFDRLCEKLIYRHPHVFGSAQAETAGEVCKNWEQLKLKEKDGNKSLLSGVPVSLPSLIKAYRMQEKAANVGFDWEKKEDVWDKVSEELQELRVEIERGDKAASEAEFGDFVFSLVNAARLYGINPDNALELTNKKFYSRFSFVEQRAKEQGRALRDMTLGEMDELWNEAKRVERNNYDYMQNIILRKACLDDALAAYQCIEDARVYHSLMGFVQWHPEYPTLSTIYKDIEDGIGYVFTDGNDIVGYCCVAIGNEPAYNIIRGAWKTEEPYAVVHRMAFSQHYRGKGLSRKAFALIKHYCIENGTKAIRVDTQSENKVMQHILEREGFEYCGLVEFDGGPKLAYELGI